MIGVLGSITISVGVLFLYRDTCQQWARGDRDQLLNNGIVDMN